LEEIIKTKKMKINETIKTNKILECHKLIVQGLVNGLSHTHQDERLNDVEFWRKRPELFNLFSLCVLNLLTEQNYEYDENQLKEIAEKGYKK